MYRHYEGLVEDWRNRRAQFREENSMHRRQGRVSYNYPEELKKPLPKFSVWLQNHVRQLVEDEPDYPMSLELWALSSPPS
jgi:hypothetical protein